jgi:hypothetical protein
VLTIFLCLFLHIYVSYIWTKYSDFGYFGFYKIFQIWGIIDGMGILENFENAWDPELPGIRISHLNTYKGDPITYKPTIWENL